MSIPRIPWLEFENLLTAAIDVIVGHVMISKRWLETGSNRRRRPFQTLDDM
jgi:hypothetical protein